MFGGAREQQHKEESFKGFVFHLLCCVGDLQ